MYSQAGQDDWVLSHIEKGTYLEIGASHPKNINNTYALELAGWTGLSIDIDLQCQDIWRETRQQPLLIADALIMDWAEYFQRNEVIDYLQIDIDPAIQSLEVLKKIINKATFNLITFEHDFYLGVDVRTESREILTAAGYRLDRADVEAGYNMPFEDWWIKI